MLRLSVLSFVSTLAGILLLSHPSAAENEVRADFISGVFAKEGLCKKVEAIEAGGPKNIGHGDGNVHRRWLSLLGGQLRSS